MNELIIGFEYTDVKNNKFFESFPNGWPNNDDELFDFLTEDYKTSNLWWMGDFDSSNFLKTNVLESFRNSYTYAHDCIVSKNLFNQNGEIPNYAKVMNVNTIENKKYIFPFFVPCASLFQLKNFFVKGIYLSEKVKNDCRNGFCKILVAHHLEGDATHFEIISEFIRHQAEFHKLPLDSFAFLDGNILTPKLFGSLGIKGFSKMTWENRNTVLNPQDFEKSIYNLLYNEEKPYYFLCLNRRSRTHRIIVTSEIFNRWNDKFLWSLLEKFVFPEEYFHEPMKMYQKNLFKNYETNITTEFYNILPKTIDFKSSVNDHNIRLNLQQQAYINVVTETIFFEPNTLMLTEKIYKPIIGIQPFIVVGPHNILKTLKDEGYKTFHPYINEEYDNIENNEERMKAIFREINRIAQMKKSDVAELTRKLSTRCIHNYYHWKQRNLDNFQEFRLIQDLKEWLK